MNSVATHPAQNAPSWSDEDRARADHYALLARLFFAPPDAGLLTALRQSAAVLGEGGSPFQRAWAALGDAAALGVEAVSNEHDALFSGVGRQEIMPYGSFYLTGFLMEEPLAELRGDLADLGLGRRDGIAETEDHIGAVCEVMRHLVLTGPDDAGLARQQVFFARHLQPWYARLADTLEASPNAHFYARVGALLRAFLDIETEAFAMD